MRRISKVFRNEGVDRTHNPEFTMMECYQAFADYHDIMDLVEEMFRTIARELTGSTTITFQGQTIDFGRWRSAFRFPGYSGADREIDILRSPIWQSFSKQFAPMAYGSTKAKLGQAG